MSDFPDIEGEARRAALKEACAKAGSEAKLAELVGKTRSHVSKWKERRKLPAEFVIQIEAATGVSRHRLRPDVFGPAPQEGQAA